MEQREAFPRKSAWGAWASLSLAMAVLLAACGAESKTLDPDLGGRPPVPRDAAVTVDGPAPDAPGPSCEPPEFLIIRTMPEGANIAPGWTGLTHNIGIPENVVYAVRVYEWSDDCTFLKFRGPVDHPLLPFDGQRCVGNTSRKCDATAPCGGEGPCRFFYGPGVQIANPEVCLSLYFEELLANPNDPNADLSPVQGSVDLSTGDVTLDSLNIRTKQTLGQCNACNNDLEDTDGKRDGTCTTALPFQPPAACDVQGRNAADRGFSLDCPVIGIPAGAFTLQNGPMSTSSAKLELTEESPPCGLEPLVKCWCGVCSGTNPAGQVCTSDADCEDRNNGSCGPAAGSRTDACVTTTDFFFSYAACNVTDPTANVGTCLAVNPFFEASPGVGGIKVPNTPCFRGNGVVGEKLEVRGEPALFDDTGTAVPKLASAVCVPASGDQAVDKVTGMPGPGIFETQLEITLVGGSSGAAP